MNNIFEHYPKSTLSILALSVLLIGMIALEFGCRSMGLGSVVVYESSPMFGYRPIENQTVTRFNGKVLSFNELGLRTASAWDRYPDHRILFLGDSITYGGSYIDNTELFSSLVEGALEGWAVGNAGVNGWGVMNVHGLVEKDHFLPASVYVSVFPDEDFERGLVRLMGTPFWSAQPKFALEELFQYWVYKLSQRKWSEPVKPTQALELSRIRRTSVEALASYDAYLKKMGFRHIIYITPTKRQLLGITPKEPELDALFKAHTLDVRYLSDSLQDVSKNDIPDLYHDMAHLSVAGHQKWAEVIIADLQEML